MQKTCKYCGKLCDNLDFEVAYTADTKVYRRLKCKRCKQNTQNNRRKRISEWYVNYKKTLVCEKCGFNDYRAITFHHKDQDDKRCNISDMLTWSVKRIQKEIDKCNALCFNCHMILEYEKRNDET